MADEPFDPIKEFTNLRDNLSRSLEKSVRSVTGATNYPAVDVYDTGDSVVIRTSPIDGLVASSIEVSMEDGVLTISGNAEPDADIPADAVSMARERHFGRFERKLRIPREVKAAEAKAKLNRSALTVTLPKIKDTRPQVIDVTPTED